MAVEDFPFGALISIIGVVVPVVAFLWEFVLRGRKRLGYRVQMDTTVTGEISAEHVGALELVHRETARSLVNPSFVLLRIENHGTATIKEADYRNPEAVAHGVQIRFPGRTVAGFVVTELSDSQLVNNFGEKSGLTRKAIDDARGTKVGVIELPKARLNRDDHYKVLAVLEPAPGNGPLTPEEMKPYLEGNALLGGRVVKTESGTGLSRRTLALLVFLVAIIIAQFGVYVFNDPSPLDCAKGNLTLTGSTAFAPVLEEATRQYRNSCGEANFTVAFHGSTEGLRTLNEAGRKAGSGPDMLSFTDGAKEDGYPQLLPRPVAFSLFTLVANKQTGIQDLRADQIRQLYDGRVGNWRELGGADLPVRLISRSPDSGTRRAFQTRILDGKREPGTNSDDCLKVGPGGQPGPVRCERPTTAELLNAVANTPGALGYAELGGITGRDDLVPVRIDGHPATLDGAVHAAYPFWETEYAYTYGEPKAGSLAASFLRYLTNQVGKDVIRSFGNRPCAELANPVLCHP
ncbi:PstS family phosphate ABC transporter substrate-binding protein [Amycolatopsis sp. NPDC059020]|uniref:PstS family phosphate ABC transporter substrate-binding protein n=1 Tax=unclassified Amycolatopsis TaxID=2618356 RepID=UPI00366D3598